MDLYFQLSRGEDLLTLGVLLHGFEVDGGSATATAVDAGIVLVVTPQHVQEQTSAAPVAADAVIAGELAGPSRLGFDVATGTVVTLTSDGVLEACARLRPGGSGPWDTSIELPSRLALAPLAGTTRHPSRPLTSAADVAGVWLSRLTSGTSAPVLLRAVDRALAASTDRVGDPALTADHRTKIADQTQLKPVEATRLEVTTRGGNLTATGDWDGISWTQRTTAGRDQHVRVEERVLLYPFGFHAVLTTSTVRDPHADRVPPGEAAALRRTVSLRLGDSVRETADGTATSRTFPFDRVEVTTTAFGDLGTPETSYSHVRLAPDVQALVDESARLADDATVQESVWSGYVAGQGRDLGDLERRGDGTAAELRSATAEKETAGADAAWVAAQAQAQTEAAERAAAVDREIEVLQAGTTGPDGLDGESQQRLTQLVSDSAQLWAEARTYGVDFETTERIRKAYAAATDRVAALEQALAGVVGQPRDVLDAANLGELDVTVSTAALTWLDDQAKIADLDRRVAQSTTLAHAEPITSWLRDAGGRRLLLPVRLSRGDQVVDVRMPMLLVHDYAVPAAEEWDLPAYTSLEDPLLPGELDRAWAEPASDGTAPASVVDAGGVLLDLVGAAAPRPADTHVVRTLNLVGGLGLGADLFTPSLGRLASELGPSRWSMAVALPALQALGGGVEAVADEAVVAFSRQYVELGEDADVLLDLVTPIGIDFTHAADRSGGLAALQLAADGISRDHGPVQLASLLEHPDPAALIGEAATLLGFRLRDLLRLAPRLEPPTIVSEVLDGGRPQVRMEWHAGPLTEHLAFKPGPATTLDLTVLAQVDGVVTDCSVNDVGLQFPFEGQPLVLLHFDAITFHQQTTYGVDVTPGVGLGSAPGLALEVTGQVVTHPPTLTISGFDVTFQGPLELLKDLQEAVSLDGNVPAVTATSKGVTATFSVPVPDVSCGVFSLSNLTFRSQVDVPFDDRPVAVSIAFASRDKPFSLSVLSFTGGGYIDIRIDADGPRIDASLEFGAQLAVDFVVAKGEVHALGGVQFLQEGSRVAISGYLRLGGSLEILSLVSVSIELRIALAYDTAPAPRLVGRATLVLEIDLTLWSDSIEIDSGEWVLQGGSSDARGTLPQSATDARRPTLDDATESFDALELPVSDAELEAWRSYRASFSGGAR